MTPIHLDALQSRRPSTGRSFNLVPWSHGISMSTSDHTSLNIGTLNLNNHLRKIISILFDCWIALFGITVRGTVWLALEWRKCNRQVIFFGIFKHRFVLLEVFSLWRLMTSLLGKQCSSVTLYYWSLDTWKKHLTDILIFPITNF